MLGDDVAGILPELRAHALSRMTSTAHVERVLSVTADPLTGADVVQVEFEPDLPEPVPGQVQQLVHLSHLL